jgi:O-antigen ligase
MKSTISDRIIWLLTTVLFSSFVIFDSNVYISYILIGITGLIFIVMTFKYNYKLPISVDTYQYHILVFIAYCAITGLWAKDASASIGKAISVFEIMICMTVLYCHYSRKNSVLELLEVIRYAGYIISIYAVSFYGMDTIRSTIAAEGRLDSDFANINTIAVLAAISIVLTFFQLMYYRISFSMILSIPEIIMVAATGSRKGFMIVVLGIILLFIFKYASHNLFKTILRYILIAILLIIVFRFILMLPIFFGVEERMKGLIATFTGSGTIEHSALLRKEYIEAGIEQFKKTPIFGIGIGNSGYILMNAYGKNTYLHNNFVEMLASGGVVGFLIYYAMFLWPICIIWKYRKFGDSCKVAVIILMIILLIMDFGQVSYYSKTTYFYLMVFYLEAKLLLRRRVPENNLVR